jgi:NAD(P)-dependent dehydrogenase (short-subunit alcohol dehydrogenase family)
MSTKQKLQGKVAVITGGNSGIGLATAKRFVAEGAYVFITGRRQMELDGAVKTIGENVNGIQGDVAELGDLDRIYSTIREPERTAIRRSRIGSTVSSDHHGIDLH